MSVRVHLALLAIAAVCLPVAVVVGSGLVMFGMHDERKFWPVSYTHLTLPTNREV